MRRLTSRPGPTVRGRLTLSVTVVFAVLGFVLLGLDWLSARQLIEQHREELYVPAVSPVPVVPNPGSGMTSDPNPVGQDPATSSAASTPSDNFAKFEHAVLVQFVERSVLILVVLTVVAAALSWWISRHSLRRLAQVTAAAQRINSDRNLDGRLALTGPDDEVRRLGDTFDAMLDRLGRSFDARRRFTAHASHELRTPLTLQRTALEIPLAQGRVPADLEPAIRSALAATARSERLISALLALAAGERGLAARQPVDLTETVGSALADLRAEIEGTGLVVDLSLTHASPLGDPALLAQLTVNLVANAVRHNHSGGTVRIAAGTDVGGAFLEVVNTGPMVDRGDLPGLFEPFQRGSRVEAKGAGLGLAVVQAVADAHEGRVTAAVNRGGGLTVRVELPVSSGS
jgi:signal transduction histidine kinase